jgi:hypothetical protein
MIHQKAFNKAYINILYIIDIPGYIYILYMLDAVCIGNV